MPGDNLVAIITVVAQKSGVRGDSKELHGYKCSCQHYNNATTSEELVFLVKEAEKMMILNGIENIEEHISILRGVYYGTEWSMDYELEKSGARNIGFKIYTVTITSPKDARVYLKCLDQDCKSNLFEALKKSPEINLGKNNAFDWGHAIIGLESRTKYVARSTPNPLAGYATGLEANTWVGDIGGGTGQLAYNRATKNINLKAKPQVFEKIHDYGSIANLEGDIGGYLIAREEKSKYDSPTSVSNKKTLSEFLADYLYHNPNEWTNRAKVFLQMLGGKLNAENKLENKEELKNKISTKLSNFGDLYVLNRINDKNKLVAKDLFETSRHLEGAGNEISEIFIDILETSITYPNKKLNSSIDPLPSKPGEAHNKYKIMKKSEDLYEKGKKYGIEMYEKARKKIGL